MANGARRRTTPPDESATALLPQTLRERLQQWRAALIEQTNSHPARTMALAVGAGYVLGGGLFSALTGRIVATGVRLGLRLAVVPMMSQSIAALAGGLAPRDGDEGAEEDEGVSAAEDVSPKKSGSQTRASSTNPGRQTESKETHS